MESAFLLSSLNLPHRLEPERIQSGRNPAAKQSSPVQRLKYLLETSCRNASDLLEVFGQRSHVNEALNGKRPISADQARKLGAMFRVKPGVFI